MSKLPTPAKLGLLAAAVVVALVAGWFLAIAPKRSEAAKLRRQVAATRAQIVAARSSSLPQHGPKIRVADLFELSRAMPNRADMPSVLLQLSDTASETGISFESIAPHDPVSLGQYQRIQIDLTFEGHFYDLSDFLFRLRNLVGVHQGVLDATGRLFVVDSVSFGEGVLKFPQVKALLTVSAYVFGDGTAAPIPAQAVPLQRVGATTTTPATDDSRPIPPAPPGATAAGA